MVRIEVMSNEVLFIGVCITASKTIRLIGDSRNYLVGISTTESLLPEFKATMVRSMEEYEALRKHFLSVAKNYITSTALNELKIFYSNSINSVRTLDHIQDIDYLVRVLEKRRVIHFNDIEQLKWIANKYFPYHSAIKEKLDRYSVLLQNYVPRYPANTNLYKLRNGECFLKNRHFNDLSLTNTKEKSLNNLNLQSSLKYQFAYELPFRVITDEESSNCNNLITSTSFPNDRWNAEILFKSNFSSNENRDLNIKDENFENRDLCVIQNVAIPSTFTLKTEQTLVLKKNSSTPLLIEQIIHDNHANAKSSFLSTPQSPEPQTINSSQIDDTLSDQSRENLSPIQNLNKKKSLRKLLRMKEVRIVLTILFVGLFLFIFVLMVCHLLENSEQYNSEPSAPSPEEDYPGSTKPLQNVGNQPPWNPNIVTGLQHQLYEHPVYYNTCFPVIPRSNRKILSEAEESKQQMVFERVSEKMGRYWREVARRLEVREFEIDNIDQYNCTLTEKAYTALKIFARDSNPETWQRVLKKGLNEARRNDLSEFVEELLSRKY